MPCVEGQKSRLQANLYRFRLGKVRVEQSAGQQSGLQSVAYLASPANTQDSGAHCFRFPKSCKYKACLINNLWSLGSKLWLSDALDGNRRSPGLGSLIVRGERS